MKGGSEVVALRRRVVWWLCEGGLCGGFANGGEAVRLLKTSVLRLGISPPPLKKGE